MQLANIAGDREQQSLALKGRKHDRCYRAGSFFLAVPSAVFLRPHQWRAVGDLIHLERYFESFSKRSLCLTQSWPRLLICDHVWGQRIPWEHNTGARGRGLMIPHRQAFPDALGRPGEERQTGGGEKEATQQGGSDLAKSYFTFPNLSQKHQYPKMFCESSLP